MVQGFEVKNDKIKKKDVYIKESLYNKEKKTRIYTDHRGIAFIVINSEARKSYE